MNIPRQQNSLRRASATPLRQGIRREAAADVCMEADEVLSICLLLEKDWFLIVDLVSLPICPKLACA